MDIPPERLAGVGRMLKRRVTVEEAIAIMALFDGPAPPKKRKRQELTVASPPLLGDGPHAR